MALKPEILLPAGQVAGAWACGSVFMGTAALLVLHVSHPSWPGPSPIQPGTLVSPGILLQLTPLERLAGILLVLALFCALGVLGWRTAAASWLAGGARARLLWALLVAAGGLAGWAFAAEVTFAAGFGPGTQLLLAYLAGGLPFGLTAAMLLRSWQINLAAIGASAVLVAAGFLMIAGHPGYPQPVYRATATQLTWPRPGAISG